MGMPLKDIVGKKFNRLTVLARHLIDNEREAHWLCLCECGEKAIVRGGRLRKGKQQSCGCYAREVSSTVHRTHGMAGTRTFHIWSGMHDRCRNPNNKDYPNYGGRGIKVCARWLKFEHFYEDMGDAPPKLSIERNDNSRDYEKSNCRWATATEQGRNKRNNRIVTYRGKEMTLMEACERAGNVVYWHKARDRIDRGWPVEEAVEFAQDARAA